MPLRKHTTHFELPIAPKTGNYTLDPEDAGREIRFTGSGAATFTLSAAAGLGNGFTVRVRNQRDGDLTIQPDGADLIDGAATLVITAGESNWLSCDGSGWATLQQTGDTGGSGMTLLSVVDASSSLYAALTGIDATYDVYMVIGSGIYYDTSTTGMRCQVATGSSSWQSANYLGGLSGVSNGASDRWVTTNGSYFSLSPETMNGGNNRTHAMTLWLHQPANTSRTTTVNWHWTNFRSGYDSLHGGGTYDRTTPVTGIRFYNAGWNHSAGTYRLYGVASALS